MPRSPARPCHPAVDHLTLTVEPGSQADAALAAQLHGQSPQGSGGVIVPGHRRPPSDGIPSIMHPVTV